MPLKSHEPGGRQGVTLIELMMVLTLIGAILAITAPRLSALTGRAMLRGGVADVRTALTLARAAALRRGEFVAFVGDAARGRIRVVSGADTLYARDLAARGIAITLTRDSITFAPSGVGWGAANTTITVRRGALVDTVVVSRLGRVR